MYALQRSPNQATLVTPGLQQPGQSMLLLGVAMVPARNDGATQLGLLV